MLKAVADEPEALSFSTVKGLMDTFYDRKRRDCEAHADDRIRFGETIKTLVENMSHNQRIYALAAVLDDRNLQRHGDVMASEHVLVRDGSGVRFFHEAFFDYAFARSWLVRDETLLAFLLSGEQELFRRAQVRQVLIHLRADDAERFVAEVDSLLGDAGIRFHIKEVVIALLRAIDHPTAAEWQLVERHIATAPAFVERLWSMLRTPAWFDRLDAMGVIEGWLGEDGERFGRAMDVMVSVSRDRPARLAALLASVPSDPRYGDALGHLSFYVDLHTSREMFELVLDGVRDGLFDAAAHDLFMSSHALGTEQPRWACELLKAWFLERADPYALDAGGKITALEGRDHGAQEIIVGAAGKAPADFAAFTVPYLLGAMAATDNDDHRPRRDQHFGLRTYTNARDYDLDEALLYGARDALRGMVTAGAHAEARPLLEALAADQHDGAQWLLFEALAADGATYADWAVELLGQGEHRLLSGYLCDPFWTARELVVAIAPHVSDEQAATLEQVSIAMSPKWESRPPGRASWVFLTALPEERLSEQGRRRLQELRRLFGDEPKPPTGITVGHISAPIPQPAAAKMSDEQWLRAIAKYSGDHTDYEQLTGGAYEQATVLQEQTKTDSARFAALALGFDRETHPAYASAVLRGLSEAHDADPQQIFELMRHVARMGIADNDQALVNAVRRRLDADVPHDIIALLLDRALHSQDPESEAWQQAGGGAKYYNGDPFGNGMNSARGAAALTLGDLLVHDADGHRTALISLSFEALASDPSTAVRSCVAHLLAAGLRHARPQAVAAFEKLIDAPDELLGTNPVESLVVYIGFGDSALVEPVIVRMLASTVEKTREAGGRLAAFGAMELELGHLLDQARTGDAVIRRGAAGTCAHRLPITSDVERAETALREFFGDEDDKVRDQAAEVAAALRNRALAPHRQLLEGLVVSQAFEDALPQLLITLEQATEAVDELVTVTARRFIEAYRGQLHTIATRAAGDAKEVGELVLRAYAQAPDAGARRLALDLIDHLLAEAAYNFSQLIDEAER